MTRRRWRAALLATLTALAVGACGGGGPRTSSHGTQADTTIAPTSSAAVSSVTMVQQRFPDSLDPQAGDSPQSAEATWVTYTGLVSYAHRDGPAGAALIPGLATTLPRISGDGRIYTVTLRRGLTFSDGLPVRATDFVYSLQRAIRLPWPGAKRYLDSQVVGADAFADDRARSVSGVSADDRTGQIVIHLTSPDIGFLNVLADPALGIIPRGSRPFAIVSRDPPPGCGPYEIRDVEPSRSYTLARNPHWKPLPGIPDGKVNIDVKVSGDAVADADAVLNNTADLLDWPYELPQDVTDDLAAKAPGRFAMTDIGAQSDYVFLNVHERPFSSRLAREAVVVGLDRDAVARATPSELTPACELLPPAIVDRPVNGHCPDGESDAGDLTRARALVRESGMSHATIAVGSPTGAPAAWMAAYTRFLNSIGFSAMEETVKSSVYASIVGHLVLHPQTGFESANAAVPDPVALYRTLLDGHEIVAAGNRNLGEIDDARLDGAIARLAGSTSVSQADAQWAKVDDDVARGDDVAVLGYVRYPFLVSARMDDAALKINPIYGWDYTSLQLK